MASKFVRSVKDIYNLQNFNTNLLDENDICSTVDGDVYIYTKNGFLHLESIDPLQDEVQEVQEKLSDNEKRIYDNEEKIKVIETSVEYNQLKVKEVTEKLEHAHLDEMKQKLDSINIDELKQEQETLSKKIDETTNETNKKFNRIRIKSMKLILQIQVGKILTSQVRDSLHTQTHHNIELLT